MYDIGNGEIAFVGIDDINVGVNIKNIRQRFDEDRIKELAESIFEDGLINPVVIMDTEDEDGNEVIELVCGARRLRAIQYIRENMDEEWGDGEVKCTQFTGTIEDAEILNGMENLEREDVDDVDTAEWLHRMVEDRGHSQADLAKKIHKSPTWVSNRITFHRNACDELRDAVREQVVNFTAAYQLAARLNHEDQKKRVQRARTNNEKITLEEAERAGDRNTTKRPGKKQRKEMLELAEKHMDNTPNARGVAMALRYVDGLLTGEELEEIIKWEKTDEKSVAPADDDAEPDEDEAGEE